jgi:hypothetical protein
MPPAPYPDFRWFFRSLRALPIVAIAALFGSAIGGFSVFAVDVALTAPPSHDAGAEIGKIAAEKAPDTAATASAAGTSAPPVPKAAVAETKPPSAPAAQQSTPQMQASGTPQAKPRSVPQIVIAPPFLQQQPIRPDAVSRQHMPPPATAAPAAAAPGTASSVALQPTPSVEPQQTPSQPAIAASGKAAPTTLTGRNVNSSSDQPADAEIPRRAVPATQRVGRRYTERAASSAEASPRTGRPIYDSYGRADEAGRPDARARYPHSNYSERSEQSGPPDGYVEEFDRGDAMPPQPPPPPLFFGLFGGGDQ